MLLRQIPICPSGERGLYYDGAGGASHISRNEAIKREPASILSALIARDVRRISIHKAGEERLSLPVVL